MPFSEWARSTMLNLLLEADGIRVAVGTENTDPGGMDKELVRFQGEEPSVMSNADEVVFPRHQGADDASITHWFVYGRNGHELARDKLERPILLRKGERATFPAGSLRLELR